ncbi:hypothetical protein QOZ80_4AG0312120 [Eleusine coracana subsp. coracana]|nr:hypothetical protein QOZ80_4AG0312120 [Eleusine coracana subsp. coracana]
MAPPWILLDRNVKFVMPRQTSGEGKRPSVEFDPTRRMSTLYEDITQSMVDKLHAMKPDPQALEPPELSHLSMVNEMGADLSQGHISSSDKALVALYAGRYRSGSGTPKSGCYLVYDASDSSLCAIPQLPDRDRHTFRALGYSATILSLGKGSYVLAELVKLTSGFPDAYPFVWHSRRPNQQEPWIIKKVRLPAQVIIRYFNFTIHMVFIHTESRVCWVDLLKGILVCNPVTGTEFTFVPLSLRCYIESDTGVLGRPGDFRTLGSVCDAIKFVTLEGLNEACSKKEVTMKTWTLSHDLKD